MPLHRLVLFAFFTACASSTDGTFTAHGDVASVGVVRQGDALAAYVCGQSDEGRATWTRWFASTEAQEDPFTLERDGWMLTLHSTGDGLDVDIDGPDGESESVVALDEPTAGLFEHDGFCRDGAIISDGTVVGSWCSEDSVRFQVEPVDTLVPDDNDEIEFQPVGDPDSAFTAVRTVP